MFHLDARASGPRSGHAHQRPGMSIDAESPFRSWEWMWLSMTADARSPPP
jgi:hypothetical protein